MFLPLIVLIISLLAIASMQSIYGLLSFPSFFTDRLENAKSEMSKEKIMLGAIDSYCQKNFAPCVAKFDGTATPFTVIGLQHYYPVFDPAFLTGSSFVTLQIDGDFEHVHISHSITTAEDRKLYFNNLKSSGIFGCVDGDVIPCTGTAVYRKQELSPELRIMFIDDQLPPMEAELLLLDPATPEYAALEAKINAKKDRKIELQNMIAARVLL